VWIGANDPQEALPHVTDQSTPAFESCATTAVIGLEVPTCKADGGVGLKETEIRTALIVMVAEIDFVASAVEVATTFTVFPEGTAAGAVYVVALPLAVWAGLNDPQAPALPQVTDQSTPLFDESLATDAVIEAVVLISRDDGGAALKETAITGGGGGFEVELAPPPHPTKAKSVNVPIRRRVDCLAVITTCPFHRIAEVCRRLGFPALTPYYCCCLKLPSAGCAPMSTNNSRVLSTM
jgi:hypothetical protein